MLIDIGSFLVIIPAAILCLFPMKNQLKICINSLRITNMMNIPY